MEWILKQRNVFPSTKEINLNAYSKYILIIPVDTDETNNEYFNISVKERK